MDSITKAYVYIGGHGYIQYEGELGDIINGGYNGGGNSKYYQSCYYSSGGGATDIRIKDNDMMSRIIVAGGGGGYSYCNEQYNRGGYGGGLNGGYGYKGDDPQTKGGTQEYETKTCTQESCWCGSGGGWSNGIWGGGGGAAGGGGSGFVFNKDSTVPDDYKLSSIYYLLDSQTIDETNGFLSPLNFHENGHRGNGYAKITILKRCTCKIKQFPKIFVSIPFIFLFFIK